MKTGKDIEYILRYLKKVWENYESPLKSNINLRGNNPFEILISTILSLRTKDEVTYPTAKRLFEVCKTPEDFLEIPISELEKLIYPVGFYRMKAKNIKKLAEMIIQNHDGKVPETIEELMKLPGVGRKVANLVISVAYGKDAICVDTHVHRISNRIGLVRTKTPTETEFKLMELLPRRYWKDINYLFVGFGQVICKPIKPKCNICEIRTMCNFFERRFPNKGLLKL